MSAQSAIQVAQSSNIADRVAGSRDPPCERALIELKVVMGTPVEKKSHTIFPDVLVNASYKSISAMYVRLLCEVVLFKSDITAAIRPVFQSRALCMTPSK
eukprot:scaffold350248_cov18-Prasinocladus_malaysianus.AAC.1